MIIEKIKLDLSYPLITTSNPIYLVDISGNDSIAALIKVIESKAPLTILPTVISLACEYGDKKQFEHVINEICIISEHCKCLPAILIDVNDFWEKFISTHINEMVRKFIFFSPCIPCHLIMHLIRIKIALSLNIKAIISGERSSHSGKKKINQLPFVLDFFNSIYCKYGINHLTPVRDIDNNDEIKNIMKKYSVSSVKLNCLFSGTYYKKQSGELSIDEVAIKEYVFKFLAELLETFEDDIFVRCEIIS